MTPGPALDIAPMVSIEGAEAHPKSHLFLTTVLSDMDVSVADWIRHRVDGAGELMPRQEVIPPDMSREEYGQLVTELMEESKVVAKIVALGRAGYEVKATGEGARVESLLPGTTAGGILQEGDVVVAAEGQQIQTATDLVNLVRRQKPGSTVSLSVQRAGDAFEARVATKESDSEPGIAVIGILIKTHNFGHSLPLRIDIDSQNIGGPSAGLMFTLAIIDALDADGLAPGHTVAGTGTMSLDGTVGPVGGVAQKVVGAEDAGAEYFLAPADNVEAAKGAAKRVKVVRVDTVDDAIQFLRTLKRPAASASVPFSSHRADTMVPAA